MITLQQLTGVRTCTQCGSVISLDFSRVHAGVCPGRTAEQQQIDSNQGGNNQG